MRRMNRTRRAAIAIALVAVGGLLVPAGGVPAVGATHRSASACTNSDLRASYHSEGGGLGHVFGRIVLRNTSDHRCRTGGYGGLSYVAGNTGFQVGAAARRDHSTPVRTILLRPGQKAKSEVSETMAANSPKHKCRPHHVRGFRVYVPNATAAQYIPHPTTGCRNHKVHLLFHKAYTKVHPRR
jgi:hypothetical protein